VLNRGVRQIRTAKIARQHLASQQIQADLQRVKLVANAGLRLG
jgi:hypothetical protein